MVLGILGMALCREALASDLGTRFSCLRGELQRTVLHVSGFQRGSIRELGRVVEKIVGGLGF